MQRLWQAADFLRDVRRKMRFGELSRASLRLLRLEVREDAVECDWIVRPADEWDRTLRPSVRLRNESLQALKDAISIRALLFDSMPQVESAVLRAFRQEAREPPELIILGSVSRDSPQSERVVSLVMRAKLYGFCFSLEGGLLRALLVGDRTEQLIT